MECIHCKGRLERSAAPFSIDRHGYQVRRHANPAWVCTQCHEPLFEAREVEFIQQPLDTLDRQSAELGVAG
ncbi:MAG: hypothetical protein HYZ53_01605 [Planctomycetes bacterium]|nr:hypothetical protein [Planctomycetota bacterium]